MAGRDAVAVGRSGGWGAGPPAVAMADAAADGRRAVALPARLAVLRTAALHAVAWLTVANGVGLLLATLLLVPELGAWMAPWTYGRWMPLHLDLHLYGWCALPLVALLLTAYLPRRADPGPAPRLAIELWSGALAFGALSWLEGENSGKLFLEWAGSARVVLATALGFLALALADAFRRRLAESPPTAAAREPRGGALLRGLALLALAAVPPLLYWSASPTVYPPINPASGGATGGSLLGSTLGIVAIFLLAPHLLALERWSDGGWRRRAWILLAVHGTAFALLDHGDHSHHEALQVAALASLLVWLPVLRRHLASFAWPPGSRRWLAALAGWGGLLLATGVLSFLPGVLERWKFTNAMVAHAHVAMAGTVTSFHALVLVAIGRWRRGGPLAGGTAFALWHAGTLLQVVALYAVGTLEALDPGTLFRPEAAVTALYAVRLAGGVAMLTASVCWLRGVGTRLAEAPA